MDRRVLFTDGEVEVRQLMETADFGEALAPALRERDHGRVRPA